MSTRCERCDRCRFFHPHPPADHQDVIEGWGHEIRGGGQCRRNPPELPERELATSRWPVVFASDWCGEFEPAGCGDEVDVVPQEPAASPVLAFVREECVVAPDRRVWVEDLYFSWNRWCERTGPTAMTTRQLFGRHLASAVPGLLCRRGTDGARFYSGIGLRGDPSSN